MENEPVKRPTTIYVILLVLTSLGIYLTLFHRFWCTSM